MNATEIHLSQNEERVKRYILPLFPSDWRGFGDADEKRVNWAKSILAQEYGEHGHL